MRPAWSVILLTTLISAGQGLFLALFAVDAYDAARGQASLAPFFVAAAILASLVLVGAGLLASFFHLGHPERAWRSAAMWRTSWLSREVIALPLFMALVALYGALHWTGRLQGALAVGALAALACVALFVCTGMIYACIRFLAEWHTPLTVVNYILLGGASGFTLATLFSAFAAPALVGFYAAWALIITTLGLATRLWSLQRNARLKPMSSVQTAIGVKHPVVRQTSQGFTGSSFNTRDFFHGSSASKMRWTRRAFLLCAFVLPLALLMLALRQADVVLLAAAFGVQYFGLLAERWYFFAQANHPQNLYYQAIS